MNCESTGKRSVKAPLTAVEDRAARKSAVYKLKLSCREGMTQHTPCKLCQGETSAKK